MKEKIVLKSAHPEEYPDGGADEPDLRGGRRGHAREFPEVFRRGFLPV